MTPFNKQGKEELGGMKGGGRGGTFERSERKDAHGGWNNRKKPHRRKQTKRKEEGKRKKEVGWGPATTRRQAPKGKEIQAIIRAKE